MPTFVATYVNPQGKSALVDIEAPNPAQAKRSLRLRGIRATEIKAKQKAGATGSSAAIQLNQKLKFSKLNELLEAKPGIKEKAVFASKMSALINAGVPIVRSIDLMATQQKMPLFKRALQSISLEVNQGISLGEALRRWPKVFDKLSVAMVEAGEAGGVLDDSLKRLAKLLEDNAKLQNQIKGAMGYPVAVLVIAISVFLGMTIFIIPTFAGIFDGLGAELPWFTQMMVDLSSLLRSTFSLYLVIGLVIAIFLFGRFYATPIGRRRVDALVLKLPLFGDLIQKTATAQFCRTFSSLTRAGVPILMSLEIVREISNNSIVSDAINNSRQDVLQGIPLSVALGRMKVFPDMSISMMAIGEETGEMDAMLSKVADFYEDEVETSVKALTSMLEPALIVLVGGIVGSILLAMYMPMFAVFDQIK
ncbi:type II secretion system F family protein [Cyanobium sp. T1B-Tous]|jgi:type IV pilus assembly protein PilC|uniref:type II secretion system F family protein n=1 Tax=Cyanobium sp. T1B-Tous TaxID=2823721 RepID=UPI0020CF9A6F|nr:type II secretion system F family protein [Cyanobium sp. T1B-Tous]MCP9806302.1 type II secretion system F family protein [Cyanobium sp. T1B-Tous]